MELKDFSPEQRRAVTQSGNIIVSAGAGSGKTTVMIERIIQKLLGGARLEDMLIVTFTRAAAADIRVKLAERLSALKRDGATRAAAERAIDALPVCNIGTLHSFCQKLVKTYFTAAEIDPAATVAEEGEAAAIMLAAIRRAVDEAWEKRDEYFGAVYDALSSRRDDAGVVTAVRDIMNFALSLPDPDAYLCDIKDDAERFPELDKIFAERKAALIDRAEAIRKASVAIGFSAIENAASDIAPYIDGYIDSVRRTSHRQALDERDAVNDAFKALKVDCKKYREDKAVAQAARSVESAPYARALCAVARSALQGYAQRKSRLGKIDYSDLEHGARRVLRDPVCKREIADGIKYVFIDEYQDVNPLQAAIAEELKSGGGAEMFLVGDIKQSIYAFRRCNPKYFKDATRDPSYTHIRLNDNYRSSARVVDFVNGVFDGLMTEEFGGADYKAERLVFASRRGETGEAEFCAVEEETANADTEAQSCKNGRDVYSVRRAACGKASDAEIKFITDSVLDWIESEKERAEKAGADGVPKTPSFGSVAVLVRSARGEFCAKLQNALGVYGIKCGVGKKSRVSDYPEAVGLIDILRSVDNRFDDIALFTALRSGMGGFSDGELAEIAERGETAAKENGIEPAYGFGRKSYTFWQKAAAYDGRLRGKLDAFYSLRGEIALYAKSHDCADTLGYITSRIDYFQYVYENGGNAHAVEALIEYAAKHRYDVHTFLTLCDSTDIELDASGGGDAVTVTTVHSSKGLEYDFVIVADTAHRFNMEDVRSRVIVSEAGVFVKYPDVSARKLLPSVGWLVENALAPDRLRMEELRLFYVALTRARRKLLVCGKKNAWKKDGKGNAYNAQIDFMRGIAPKKAEIKKREKAAEAPPQPIDPSIVAAVKARCEFKYDTCRDPIKTCVTALASDAGDDYTCAAPVLTDDDRGAVSEKDGATARSKSETSSADAKLKGTAYHRAMELVDFNAPDTDMLERECENFALVDARDILRAAEVMKSLTDGALFYSKERYFIADMTADEIGRRTGTDGSVLVQGVIDLLIVDKDGCAVIVDYKTTAPERLVCDEYFEQLRLYAAAVEKATPYRVKKRYLYSFVTGELVDMSEKIGA
ncbi:MAG: UvrD-helicase domain-containing protein [Roseburia sp.]|nr:UvrD-helicase domain-containing protein [Roseburia sp.]